MLSEFLAIFISAALIFVDPKFPKIFSKNLFIFFVNIVSNPKKNHYLHAAVGLAQTTL